ncbi:MAG TPA: PHP domain-containing protein [bacterium]|nr:PHP domain-containing protein [bacterium]
MIDLHTHSTASDGACTPERLVDLASSVGLSALALTDHDTLDGLARATAQAAERGILVLPGVEIEIEHAEGEFHLLGLGLDGDTGPLREALEGVQAARRSRNDRMAAKLQAGGYPITIEEVRAAAGGEIVSRAHFAQVLVRKKLVGSMDAVFKKLLGKGMPFYEPRACLELREASRLIALAGGIPVIAHPVSLGLKGPSLRTFVAACRDQGVGGVEAWHPNHSVKECRKLERMAVGLGMAVSGGSDFHGEHLPNRKLGFTSAGREIPDRFLEPFLRGRAR